MMEIDAVTKECFCQQSTSDAHHTMTTAHSAHKLLNLLK